MKFKIFLTTTVPKGRIGFGSAPKTKAEIVEAKDLGEAAQKAIAKTSLRGLTPVQMSAGWSIWP